MSDFFNSGWSVFIAVGDGGQPVACLAAACLRQPPDRRWPTTTAPAMCSTSDLVEMNNPMPMWWVVLFVLTVIFALVYVYAFPALGSVAGSLGWTSRGELDADQARASREMAKVYAAYSGVPAETLSQDAKAMAIGQRLFINNCATCHGSDARGSKGFPNLTDSDWLHGGTPAKIEETITARPDRRHAADGRGRRHVDRRPQRRPLRAQPLGEPAQLDRRLFRQGQVRGLRCLPRRRRQGQPGPRRAQPGDNVWLHGWGEAAIAEIVNNGKTSVMPAQRGRLSRRADPPPRELRLEPVASAQTAAR